MSNKHNINCPTCNTSIDVNDALAKQLEVELKEKLQANFNADLLLLKGEKDALEKSLEVFEEKKKEQNKIFKERLEAKLKVETSKKEAELKLQLEKENEDRFHAIQTELDEKSAKVKEFNKSKIEIARLKREKDELQATYEYYEHGPLKRVELGDELQGIDYVYTIEGWLKAINNPFDLNDSDNNIPDDIFGMSLDYYTGDYMNADVNLVNTTHTGVQDFYNGTIKAQNWLTENHPLELNTAASQKVSSYVYQYDNKYQLTAGLFGKRNSATTSTFSGAVNNALSTQSLSYDQNGNMLGLTRKDKEGVMMHDFVNKFHYETPVSNVTKGKYTNQLDKVDGYADYTYDELGQLSQVSYTGGETMKLTYNPAGLVDKITDVNNVTKVAYEYDDMGQRIIKRNVIAGGTTEDWYVRDGNGTVVSIYRKEVDGSVNQIEIPVYGAGRLGQYQLGTADKVVYELKDHLGNVRAVLNRTLKNTNEVDLLSTMNYYPYGLKHGTIGEQYRYGYQGDFAEDETDETGFNSFQLRQYDPVIGRWISVDPERQYSSPYVGNGNDPIRNVDPTGGEADDWVSDNVTNKITWNDNAVDESTTPKGFTYVGPTGDDVLNFLGFENGLYKHDIDKWGQDSGTEGWVRVNGTATVGVGIDFTFEEGSRSETNSLGIVFNGIVVQGLVNYYVAGYESTKMFESVNVMSFSYGGKQYSTPLTFPKEPQIFRENSRLYMASVMLPASSLIMGNDLKGLTLSNSGFYLSGPNGSSAFVDGIYPKTLTVKF